MKPVRSLIAADYRLAHEQKRTRCQVNLVRALMMRVANALVLIQIYNEAVWVLAARRVITSQDFKKGRIGMGDQCSGGPVRT